MGVEVLRMELSLRLISLLPESSTEGERILVLGSLFVRPALASKDKTTYRRLKKVSSKR